MTESHAHSPRWNDVSRIAFWVFVAIAAFFLVTEHRAHLFGVLPFLLLAACPLMHLFHHRGHGQSGRDEPNSPDGPSGGGDNHRH